MGLSSPSNMFGTILKRPRPKGHALRKSCKMSYEGNQKMSWADLRPWQRRIAIQLDITNYRLCSGKRTETTQHEIVHVFALTWKMLFGVFNQCVVERFAIDFESRSLSAFTEGPSVRNVKSGPLGLR